MAKTKSKAQDSLFVTPTAGEMNVGDKVTDDTGFGPGVVASTGHQPKPGPRPPAPKTGSGITKHEPRAVVQAPSDPFLALIREVVMNPGLDVTKLDALLAMQERIMDRTNRRAFDEALAKMQPKLPVIDRKGRIEIRKKDAKGERTGDVQQSTPYAKFEDIIEAITPILGRYGFGLRYETGLDEQGRVVVVTVLSGHGHREQTKFVLPHDSSGSKNAVQAVGSSTSYGRRMGTLAILNIISRGDDDDGRASGAPLVTGEALSAEQIEKVVEMAGAVLCPAPKLLDYLNGRRPKGHPEAAVIEDLPAARFEEALEALRLWEANRPQREAGPKK